MRKLGYKLTVLLVAPKEEISQVSRLDLSQHQQCFLCWLIDKLEHQLFKHGYKTIICNSEHDSEKEREYIEMLEANQVDGIISRKS